MTAASYYKLFLWLITTPLWFALPVLPLEDVILSSHRSLGTYSTKNMTADDGEKDEDDFILGHGYAENGAINTTKVPPLTATPHKGCELMLKDKQYPKPMLVGKEFEHITTSDYRVENEVGPTAAKCGRNGFAGGYPCRNVDLLSMMGTYDLSLALGDNARPFANDIWGWTHIPSGREFALIGMDGGTAFVEITDPYSPIYVGGLPTQVGHGSPWRDVKTMGDYAVIVSEEPDHGMQVFHLIELLTASAGTTFSNSAHYPGMGNAHNVFVHEETGFAYIVGQSNCNGGLHMVDLNDPTQPTFAGCYSGDGYTHDVQCVIYNGPDVDHVGREICIASNEDTVTIIDVTAKSNPILLSKKGYKNRHYTHQGWLTEDHSHFVFNDEYDEMSSGVRTRSHVMDVSDLSAPKYVGFWDGRTNAIDHNNANYRAGFNVLQIKDIATAQFEEVGYFDIYPDDDLSHYNGAWSNYPFFPSGTIIVSGIEQGLVVLKFHEPEEPASASPTSATQPPSPAPTVACVDSPLKLLWDTGRRIFPRSCHFLTKKRNRCDKRTSKSHCPVTCGVCNRRFQCSDSAGPFILNGIERTCEFFANLPKRKLKQKCEMEKLRMTCRDLCGYCD